MAPSIQPAMDTFDRKILAELQRNNLSPLRVIAETVNLSPAAVQRRISRLTREGVIRANVAVIDAGAVGLALTTIVEVTLRNESQEEIRAAKASFTSEPCVQQCFWVTGETDFVLIVVTRNMSDYEQLAHRLFLQNANIAKFRTLAVLDTVKCGFNVSLDR